MSINVLIYNGPGVSQTSFNHTLTSLRYLLSPNYAVGPVTPTALNSDPWPASCALLVIPGGRDLPYVAALQPGATDRIKEYVRKGGSLLTICAGSYFASARVEWEVGTRLEVVGDRALGFFPGTSKGCAYPGFVYESEAGARLVDVKLSGGDGKQERTARGLYWNGGGYFDGAEGMESKGIRVLARYPEGGEGSGAGKPAAVQCDVGEGRAILWGPHIEFPLNQQPALAASATSGPSASTRSTELIAELEAARWDLLMENLELLGLRCANQTRDVKNVDPMAIVGTLPQMLVSTPSRPHIVPEIVTALETTLSALSDQGYRVLEDAHDTFRFYDASTSSDIIKRARNQKVSNEKELEDLHRDIIVFGDGTLPSVDLTPLFSIATYFEHLSRVRSEVSLLGGDKSPWGIGEALLYSERVTSTQTLLDRNPMLMGALPSPLLSVATQQLSGRGRGSNMWLSPPEGCLQFSLLLRPPQSPTFRPSSLVFIQYLFGLAVVEACRKVLPGGAGDKVRLKWPNDLYVVVEDNAGKETLKKVGGILVTTNFGGDGVVDVVVGCGLNVLNPLPTASLSQLLSAQQSTALTLEQVAATILPMFEQMWGTFVAHGGTFEPFVDLYLKRWLHSDKIVALTTTTPHRDVRIVGITPDYGLLRTVPISGGESRWGRPEYIDLQPDGNSFDMMAGLIRLKK
ncbi:biotin holocarboxylase synthetase [Tulasnella sp. JGI-2019a]|nr:biotin holocarboxylase synthetase [Tulasnella sp. JGI-2019a]